MKHILKYVSAAVLFTVWPQIAAAQTTFNFPLAVGGTIAGFAIVNPNATDATATFRLYSFEGLTLGTATRPVPARGQLAILDSEVFPIINHARELGWVQVESAVGTQAFIIQGDFLTQVDGISPPTPSLQQVVPLIAGQMKVYGVNPGTARIVVQIHLYDINGTEVLVPLIGTITLEIPPKGMLAQTFDLTSGLGALVSSAVYARVVSISGGPFVGSEVVGGFLVAPGRDFGVVSGVDSGTQTTELNFPHAISGDLGSSTYSTSLGVVNLSSQSQDVTITFIPQSGSALSVTKNLKGGAALRQTIQELFSLPQGYQDGWVQVRGSAALTGFVGFADTKAGGLAVSAPPTGATALVFDHIADLNPWWTGIALVNPSDTDATIEVFAMNPNGTLIGGADNVATARFVLPAKKKTAKLLGELIPATQARTSDGGFVLVRVTNNVPIYGLELFFLRNGSAFANVAPVALPPNVNYSPPQP